MAEPMAPAEEDALDTPNYALFNLLLRTGDGDAGGRSSRSKSLLRAKAKVWSLSVAQWL